MSSTKTTTGSTTSDSSVTGSTTPNTPAFLSQPWEDFASNLQSLNSSDPYQVVGPTSALTAAYNGAQNFQTSPYLSQAGSLFSNGAPTMSAANTGPAAQASTTYAAPVSAAGGISTYLNPYTQDVTNTTMQGLNLSNQEALNDVNQGAELAGGYGGSRQGVAQALTNQLFGQTAANTLANLNSNNYTSALGAANEDADRTQTTNLANAGAANTASMFNAGQDNQLALANAQMQQQANANNQSAVLGTGSLLGSLGSTAGNQQLAQYGLLGDLGQGQYNIAENQANDPYLNAQEYTSLLGQIPSNLFVGQNTTGNVNTSGTNDSTTSSSNPFGIGGSLLGLFSNLGGLPGLGSLFGLGAADAGSGALLGSSGAATAAEAAAGGLF